MSKIKTGAGGEIYTPPPGTIQESYGIDIEDKLSSMLSDELAKSIDAEIFKGLFERSKSFKRINSIDKIYKKGLNVLFSSNVQQDSYRLY